MFSHVTLGVSDMERSKKFYDAIMTALGYPAGVMDEKGRCFYLSDQGMLGLTYPINGEPASHGNGSTIGFSVDSPETADAWHQAGIESGGVTCEDPPGVREGSGRQYYLAYLRDPDGNKLCVLHFLS